MIPVTPAPEPDHFDAIVRQKGLNALAEMVGEKSIQVRTGPKRKKLANTRAEIPSDRLPPFWRESLKDMLKAYHRLCAYSALYIEHGTGSPTVDHVIPKSKAWDKVYEWSNYRLACSLVNARKSDVPLSVDPFTIGQEWFALELVEFQVLVGPSAPSQLTKQIEADILTLGLNSSDLCRARQEYFDNYHLGVIPLPYLERRAPFIARELRRQGRLRRGDT